MIEIKYRPSLTQQQLTHIFTTLSAQQKSLINDECIAALRKYMIKIQVGLIAPSHVTEPQSLEDQLGFSTASQSSQSSNDSHATQQIIHNSNVEALLKIYTENPSILTAAQLEKVQFHRYINNMMSPDEEKEYQYHTV